MTLPTFSIIVPTYARPRQLAACLGALAELDYPREFFEVIVVDDGGGMSVEFVEPFRERINVTLLSQANAGPGAARNTGAAKAGANFLAFTDDDCAPTPGWLRALANRFALTPDHLVGGRTVNTLHENPYSTASQLLIDYLYSYYNDVPGKAHFFTSNNMAMPSARFREIGGFDKTFAAAAGEDRELCDRWLAHGFGMTYAPEAVMHHAHSMTLRKFWRQHFNYGRSASIFHCIRARRRREPPRIEPLSFYLNLLRYPLTHARTRKRLPLSALLVISQAANAAGFYYERAQSKSDL